MHAVATHYGAKVDTWSIWNEPNQPQFLLPQYSRAPQTPLSPGIYRKLFFAAAARPGATPAMAPSRC